jgi:hypothetical protein
VIHAPQEKASALSLPANRVACWGANITGEGVRGAGVSTCSPATGVVAGYKASGEEISAEVAKGSARKIDLYLYLLPAGGTAACPPMAAVLPRAQLADTYLVGSAIADFVNDTTVVEITAVFPGLTQNLAVTSSMPAACTAGAGPTRHAHISAAMQTVSGTGYVLKARAATIPAGIELAGPGYKLRVK